MVLFGSLWGIESLESRVSTLGGVIAAMTVGGGLMTKEPRSGNDTTEENKRKALEALESRGSKHDAATTADVSLKTLDDWRRGVRNKVVLANKAIAEVEEHYLFGNKLPSAS